MEVNKIIQGNCLEVLKTLPDNSIDCCVTSPPYFGLRDYRTTEQIGLEETPELFVSALVKVFSEVKRVLKDEGTLWLNIGDSYANNGTGRRNIMVKHCGNGATGGRDKSTLAGQMPPIGTTPTLKRMPNFSHFIHRSFEKHLFFIGNVNPIRPATERINVLLYDKSAPNLIFFPLLRIQSVLIKQRDNYFGQIGNGFNSPIICFFGISSDLFFSLPSNADFKVVADEVKNWGIVTTTSNLDSDASLKSTLSFAKKCRKAAFTIEVTGEPIAETIRNIQPIGDAIVFDLVSESIINVYPINQPISFSHGLDMGIGNFSDFFVAKAFLKQCYFVHKSGRLDITVFSVTHLHSFNKSGLIPYYQIYENAKQDANEFAPKNEVGIPEMLKRALKRDGWICRQTIIWHKPNPMPESVTDRCTKSHEYIFLLSKSGKYYFDADAIKTKMECSENDARVRTGRKRFPTQLVNGIRGNNPDKVYEWANKRSVWTVNTMPFTSYHESYHWHRVSSGAPSGGTRRIVSLSCPVHGCSDHQVSTQLYDARGAGALIRKGYMNDCPDEGLVNDSSPIAKIPSYYFGERSLDYSQQSYLLTARLHNSGSHKTDLDASTNQPCISFSEILSDIEHTSGQQEISGSVGRIFLNNTLPDDLDDHLWEEILYHNVNKSSYDNNCLCAIYEKITKKTDHFATFPERLITDCIKAGCPENGIVLDPFFGAGTTGVVVRKLHRNFVGIELSDRYCKLAEKRLRNELGLFKDV